VRPRLVPGLFLSFRYAFDREFSELQEMDERDKFRERYTGGKRDRFRNLIHHPPHLEAGPI
jgi:hypothetical protein